MQRQPLQTCHDIRLSYISRLFDSGLNPDEIRRIAGHENIEMTMKYCRGRKSSEELEKVLE
ncbi:MAG: site-specific integrase, partial [Lachnospiraceae bacterium]|nr:site-specific integrase [Lachnospiraceae bacterium]